MTEFQIGEYGVNFTDNTLEKGAVKRKIEPQLAELLKLFLQYEDQIISREVIARHLWSDRVVSDDALRAAIKKLREALGDNAKSPRYIKTYPMKGYQFIAPVTARQPDLQSPNLSKPRTILASIILFAVAAIVLYQFTPLGYVPTTVEPLTDMSGSELHPSYDTKNNRIAFSHREQKDDYLQLYVKDLDSDKTKRLTWGDVNYANVYWSPGGRALTYTESTPGGMSHHVATYDDAMGLTNIVTLSEEHLSDKYVLGWGHDESELYVTDKPTQNKPQSLWRYHIIDRALYQVTSPSVPGQGDYAASESPDGEMLAILRSLAANKHELLVMHIPTGELIHTVPLPALFQTLTWDMNTDLVLSSFNGVVVRYDLAESQLLNVEIDLPYTNNVFHVCGARCYFMRKHNGNYLDLLEQPNSFSELALQSLNYFELEDANALPIYDSAQDGFYFVTHSEEATEIEHMIPSLSGHERKSIVSLPANTKVTSLDLSLGGKSLAATIDDRISVIDIDKKELVYISDDMAIVYPPIWANSDVVLTYARLENNIPVLYEYNLDMQQHVRLKAGLIAKRTRSKVESLLLDDEYNLWRFNQKTQSQKLVAQIPSGSPNRWLMHGEYLYFTSRIENVAMINRVHLETGVVEAKELAKNRFMLDFDLASTGEKLIGVKSVLAQSNLVRVELASQ